MNTTYTLCFQRAVEHSLALVPETSCRNAFVSVTVDKIVLIRRTVDEIVTVDKIMLVICVFWGEFARAVF